jgi:hypothetical protein
MKNCIAPKNQTMRRLLSIGCVAALTAAFAFSAPQPAHAEDIIVPPTPDKLQPQGAEVFLEGHAAGSQNYICLPSGSGFAWTLFTPEATLFDDDLDQIITHFNSPNLNPIPSPTPDVRGTIRATWESSRDTSAIWAKAIAQADHTAEPTFVEEGAIAWVLLQAVGTMDGPNGGHRLSQTAFVQRLNTHGGSAPPTGCAVSTDVGQKAFVPYTANYFFYRNPRTGR